MKINHRIVIWLLFILGIITHFSLIYIENLWLPSWIWSNELLHTAIEISGCIISIFSAIFLYFLYKSKAINFSGIIISASLISMGILDGYHAITPPGNTFVFLHSTATFMGGIFLSLLIFKKQLKPYPLELIFSAVAISFLVCIYVFIFKENVPNMLIETKFTDIAVLLNVGRGILFFIGAIQFYFLRNKKANSIYEFLFLVIFILIGLAAVMFFKSSLFSLSWWGWHFLRLIAFSFAFGFFFISYLEQQHELITTNRNLEKANNLIKFNNEELRKEIKS